LVFLLLFSLAPRLAAATTIESDTSLGKQTSIEDLSGNGHFGDSGKKKTENRYDWNVGVTKTRSVSQDPTTGDNITDNTTDFSAGIGIKTPNLVGFGVGYDYASTPEENLTDSGPNAYLGYTYQFKSLKKKKAKGKGLDDLDEDDFVPDAGAKLTVTSLNYVQKGGKAARRKGAAALKDPNSIRQNAIALALTSNALSWFYVKLGETFYVYNKDPNKFLGTLDSSRALQNRTSGLSSTVTGFPRSETQLAMSFYLPYDWSIDFSETAARSYVDDSIAYTTKFIVAKDVGDWNFGLGVQNDHSDQTKDNLLLVNVKLFF
jgi:hypothetical protein